MQHNRSGASCALPGDLQCGTIGAARVAQYLVKNDKQYLNLGATPKHKYTSEDFLTGRIKWDQIIHPEDAPIIQKKVETFHSTSTETDSREYRIVRKNGETRWILEKFQKKYDYEKKMEGVQGIIVDITERKKAENELKELSKLKSEFLRRASHE